MAAGDIALAGGASEAMLAEAAGRFAAAIKAGNDLAIQIDHLAAGVDAQTRARVMHHRRRPGGIERRRGDFVERSGFTEILIDAESTKPL